jgi:STE24 endopeptidase
MDGSSLLVALVSIAGCVEILLHFAQLRSLRHFGEEIPPALDEFLDHVFTWKRSLAFGRSRVVSRFGMVVCGYGLLVTILSTGLLETVGVWARNLMGSEPGAGVLLGALSAAVTWLVLLPWVWARSFMLDDIGSARISDVQRFWNEQGIFLVLGMTVAGTALGGASLLLKMKAGYLWFYGIILVTEFLLMWLFPVIVIPLFFPVKPLPDGPFKERLQEVFRKAGLEATELWEVNTSKKPLAGNAMVSGLGKARKFLLFDSLLKFRSEEEITAILAHEVGHLKGNHQARRFLLAAAIQGVLVAVICVAASGRSGPVALLEGVFAAQAVTVLVFQPLLIHCAQRQEFAADAFAAGIVGASAMKSVLEKIVSENRGWTPSLRLYSLWYEPHPPVVKRLKILADEGGGLSER